MEPFADTSDLIAVMGALSEDQILIADGQIAQASMLLRALVPTVDAQIAEDTTGLKTEYARIAVVNAARRVLMNPEGWLQDSFTLDDYSRDKRRDAATSTGRNYIDPADIVGLVVKASRKWGMIRMRPTL